MDNNLLCPMQCRLNGVTVNEIPKFLVDNPTNVTHSLVFPMQEQDDDAQPTIIPLALDGVTSYFLVTKPTQEDVEDESMLHLDLTAENPPWNPQDPDFAHRERNMVDSAGLINIPDTTARGPVFISEVSLNNDAVDVSGDTDLFAQALEDNVAVTIAYLGTKDRKPDTNHIELANRWGAAYYPCDDSERSQACHQSNINTSVQVKRQAKEIHSHPTCDVLRHCFL
eukprot:g14855.t1 g14855   contig21:21911-22585(-)